jgi:hypothetical protein
MLRHLHVGSQRGSVVAPSLLLIDDMPLIGLAKVNRTGLLIDSRSDITQNNNERQDDSMGPEGVRRSNDYSQR